MAFEQILQLVILAVVVLVYWWSHRSFPPKQTAELLQKLSEASQKTDTHVDDLLVEIAQVLNELRQKEIDPPDS